MPESPFPSGVSESTKYWTNFPYAFSLSGKDPRQTIEYAVFFTVCGEYTAADELFISALQLSPNYVSYLEYAESCRVRGLQTKRIHALVEARKILQDEPQKEGENAGPRQLAILLLEMGISDANILKEGSLGDAFGTADDAGNILRQTCSPNALTDVEVDSCCLTRDYRPTLIPSRYNAC